MPDRQPTLLCVDDEETPLFFRRLVLEKSGFKVIPVNSADEALVLLENTRVDLVLSDVLMPRVTGTELARIIKERWPQLPVVLISGINEIPPEAAAADMFISKLEGPRAMCDKITALLQQLSICDRA